MISLRNLSLYATVAALGLNFAACSKKDAALETDYATKKASAETLVGQITAAKAGMMTDHDNWTKTLADAGAKPGADTSKIASLKSDLDKHMADGQALMALEDSVKAYSNATPDQGDAFKNADDRLGTNFNDLNDKWKSFQDKHADLQKNIGAMAVAAAGAPMKDVSTASEEIKKPAAATKKEAAKPAAEARSTEVKTEKKGTPRKMTQ